MKQKYTKEILQIAAHSCENFTELARKLDCLRPNSASTYIKNKCRELNVDTSHFRAWRKYSFEEIQSAVISSDSYSDVLRKLNSSTSSGAIRHIQVVIKRFKLSTIHFKRMKQNGSVRKRKPEEILILRTEDYRQHGSKLRRALIELGRIEKCENSTCGIQNAWLGQLLRLHVDHINGDWQDCRQENLRFLCPNCHSQTSTFGHRSKKKDVV